MSLRPGARIGAFKPAKTASLDLEAAEGIAAGVLAALAASPQDLVRFMTDTGLGPADLRQRAGETDMLAAVLDYVASNESLLLTISANQGIKPERLLEALACLQKPALGSP